MKGETELTKENNDKEENGQNEFNITAPHDKTFRKVLKDPRIAKDILEQNLPQ